jgi:chemotaxis protein MotB
MKPKYFAAETNQRDRWMVSYLDAITILLIFFVAIARMSMARPKPEPVPVPAPPPVMKIVDARKSPIEELEIALRNDGLDVRREPRGLLICLPQTILFSSGDDRVSPSALPVIEKAAAALRELPNPIILAGHADSVPIHNRRFKSNFELSAARGLRLLELLESRYDIPEGRMSIASEGANGPSVSNETAEGRASNRRVDILVLDIPEPGPGNTTNLSYPGVRQ